MEMEKNKQETTDDPYIFQLILALTTNI
jgi:hypothetical protein